MDFGGAHEKEMDKIKATYHENGWLTERYRKEECLQKVGEVVESALDSDSSDE